MKKWTTMILGAALAVSLSACGDGKKAEEPTGSVAPSSSIAPTQPAASPDESGKASTTPAGDNKDLNQLLVKTSEAAKSLKSFATTVKMDQQIKMKQGDISQDIKTKVDSSSEMTRTPFVVKQTITTAAAGSPAQTVEQYITETGMYSKVADAWTKLPSSMSQATIATLQKSSSPEVQLEQFKALEGQTKITEKGNEIVLTIELSGDDVKKLGQDYLKSMNGGADASAAMQQMNIEKMSIEYAVDKKTYYPIRNNVETKMSMKSGDGEMAMEMKMDSTFSKHNELSEIVVPEEALKAEEMKMPELPALPSGS
jgi:hypothetical protein